MNESPPNQGPLHDQTVAPHSWPGNEQRMPETRTACSDLRGKCILVTGASSGIGAAVALELGRVGAHVVLAARRVARLETIAQQIVDRGGQAMAVRADIGVEHDVANVVEKALARFGQLDGAFNNAATIGPTGVTHELDSDAFQATLNLNVMGLFWSMKHELAAMLRSGGGAIVNNASIAAQVGFANVAPYVASKHAVLGMTRGAALEYFKRGIRVNAVCPGPVVTAMAETAFGSIDNLHTTMADTPAGRPGQPEEIASAVLFLLSGQASYINGHGLTVDGGYTVQ